LLAYGFELARRIRASPWSERPLIASSASIAEAERGRSLAVGCNEFLPKPVGFQRLLDCLQRYLGLTWRYAAPAIAPVPSDAPLVFPPASELERLHQAARIGDVEMVAAEAERLEQLDKVDRPFGDRLRQLAGEFDDRRILALIEEALAN